MSGLTCNRAEWAEDVKLNPGTYAPPGTPLAAIVTRPEDRRTLVELTDCFYVTAIAPRQGHRPGTRLQVVIAAVHPRAGGLVVREA